MRSMKKFYQILILSLLLIGSCSLVYANDNDFTSNHILLENDKEATIKKGYPVIIATNTTDRSLDVTYNFYYDEEETKTIDKEITIGAKQSVVIEVPELKILGKTGKSRTIWFSWSETRNMKPLFNQIETYPFKNNEKPPVELG